jgi:hypothetical protein
VNLLLFPVVLSTPDVLCIIHRRISVDWSIVDIKVWRATRDGGAGNHNLASEEEIGEMENNICYVKIIIILIYFYPKNMMRQNTQKRIMFEKERKKKRVC